MALRILIAFVCFICTLNCCAQIFPAEGAKLNFTQVMFEHEPVKGATQYLLQVTINEPGASFSQCVVQQKDSSQATLVTNLKFGKKYQWRYTAIGNNILPVWNGPYHFEIDEDSFISKNIIALTVTKNDTVLNAGGLIIDDATHTIVDRNGHLVWYLPKVNWFYKLTKFTKTAGGVRTTYKNVEIKPAISDLRLTSAGTITYLDDSFPKECGLTGIELWRGPNDGRVSGLGIESYNHDFKRLPNGDYMVLGNELWRQISAVYDTSKLVIKKYAERKQVNGKTYGKAEFGTIIEYDKNGNIVWSWNSERYLDSDLLKPVARIVSEDYLLKAHINAFSTDAENKFVYAGFRDINRVIKIEKSTGNVVDSWGLDLPEFDVKHHLPFYHQHDANILSDGTLAVFNNNDYVGQDSLPNVILFYTQPPYNGKIIWNYTCYYDSLNRRATRNGGNVELLANGNYLVCLGNLDKIWEVTKDKKIVWAADIKMNRVDGTDYSYRLYRAHYISSLYPCYFTFKTDVDTVNKKMPDFRVCIFNKGSEADGYSITVSTVRNGVIKQLTTQTVAANRSTLLTLKTNRQFHSGDKINVTVSSIANSDFVRKSFIVVK